MAKKKELRISPTRHITRTLCEFRDYLAYGLGFRMPSNVNFAMGGGLHSSAEFAVKAKREVTADQLRAIFAQKWKKELAGPMYLKDKDNVDDLFDKGQQLVGRFVEQFVDREYPFDPIDYIPAGTKTPVPAAEIRYNLPCVNPITGEEIPDVRLTGIIDVLGVHDEFGFGPLDWKTGARKYSQTKIEKGVQLAHYAIACRLMLKMHPEMFPILDVLKKKREDSVMYLLFKKTKNADVEEYHRTLSDANINFFWEGLKDTIKGIQMGLKSYNEGSHCDNFCSHKPICDAIMNGEDPQVAYDKFMKEAAEFKKKKLKG